MDAMVETEIYGAISCGGGGGGRKALSTFGKEQRDGTVLVANVKPYLKSQHALSPPLQESPPASGSPAKSSAATSTTTAGVPDPAKREAVDEKEGGSDISAYGPPDGQCSPMHTELEEAPYLSCELRPKSLSSGLIHSSVISQECGGGAGGGTGGGSECSVDPLDSAN